MVSVPAWAQADKPTAEALFRSAKAFEKEGNVEGACPKYVESHRLDPKPGTILNVARCHEATGRVATAWADYLEAATFASRAHQTDREKFARTKIEELEQKLSYVELTFPTTPGLEAALDGKPLAAATAGTRIPLDPGKHVFDARAPGKAPWTSTITVPEGPHSRVVEIPALADATLKEEQAPLAARDNQTRQGGAVQPTIGWISLGVGAVGIGLGTAFGLRTLGRKSLRDEHCLGLRCDQTGVDADRSARSSATISTVSFVAGGALLAAGVILLVASRSTTPAKRATFLTPALGALEVGPGYAAGVARFVW